MNLYWLKQEEILRQVKSEFKQSESVVQQKRFTFRDRLKLYNDQVKDPSKVSVSTSYSTIQALIATSYLDGMSVEFVEREFTDASKAQTWTKVAEFDNEEMWMEEKNYVISWDKFFHWVWIILFDWWDKVRNCPIANYHDPMTRIPDPKGWLKAENFRRMWFQSLTTWDWMENNEFENIERFITSADFEFYMFNPFNKLPPNSEQDTNEDIKNRYVYYHYTTINWDKYQIATNYDMDVIGRMVKIEEVLKSEKDVKSTTLRPITLKYFRPERHNPYWTSVMDLVEDKQRAKSRLLNLAIAKTTRGSLWGHRIYDKWKIPNRNDLAWLTEEPKLIGINLNPNESLANVITETQFAQVPQDNFNVQEAIDYQVRLATGIDPLTIWISSPWALTATESQQIQENANLILWLGNKIANWWEKDFWIKWYKMYKQHFSGKKIVRLVNPLTTNIIQLSKEDLNTKYDPDVTIKSKSELDKKNQKIIQFLTWIVPFLQQEWWFAYKYGLRKLITMQWIDIDESKVLVPEMSEEIEAMMQLELLNRWEELWPVTEINQDHDAYISIYKQAMDTPAKYKAIQWRLLAKMEKDKQKNVIQMQQWQPWQQPWWNWLVNAASSQLVNSALQKQKQPVSSQNMLW